MSVQSVAFMSHFFGESFWEGLVHSSLLRVDCPMDWSSAEEFDLIEGIDVVLSENNGNDFMPLADSNEWPNFALDIFHEL